MPNENREAVLVGREDVRDPLRELGMYRTYRTWRVLVAIAELARQGAGPSNREVAERAGIWDAGQMSRLMTRLEGLGLIENTGLGAIHGKANAWWLTAKGDEVRWELEAEELG
jgi:hypothetical protein